MRHFHSTVTPAVVHHHARDAAAWERAALEVLVGKSVSVADLLDLLLMMAASAASLFAVVRRFFPFSHETASRAVKANLPTSGVPQSRACSMPCTRRPSSPATSAGRC